MEKLIIGPLKVTHTPTLIIIDALDECKGEQPASAILSTLVNEIPTVKFFIIGWPEAWIRTGFQLRSLLPIAEVFKLHEVKPETADSDIEMFFQTQLTNLIENRNDCDTTGDWPSSSDIEILCKKAGGLSSMLLQSLSLLLQQTVYLLSGLPSSPHFHGALLKKEGLGFTSSISRSLTRHSIISM